ncbi:MAG TPA: hypothetical protein ENJ23_01505 [Bacteroidetes bacterium]|nr:hypothetical protein [Bacteroidota bacterium]
MPAAPANVLQAIEIADYNYGNMHDYSNLDYGLLHLTAAAEYALTSNVALTVDLNYYDLKDNQGWVYGVESGTFYVIRTGIRLLNLGR